MAVLAEMVPFDYTPEEEARIAAMFQEQKEWELAHADERAEKLRAMWD